MTPLQQSRINELLDSEPDKVQYGKVITQLGNLSEERVRSAARKVPLATLRDIVYQFQLVIDERKGERVNQIASQVLESGIDIDQLIARIAPTAKD